MENNETVAERVRDARQMRAAPLFREAGAGPGVVCLHSNASSSGQWRALVDAVSRPPNDADGIRNTVADSGAALDAGNPEAAAERFIDFWMGKGAWARTPEARRAPIVASVANVRGWKDALFDEPTPLPAFAALDAPVLCMTGKRSPASSLAVARLLAKTLPRVEVVEFEELGHMGPVTHPEVVNEAIVRFLERV